MSRIYFTIPWPPTINHYYTRTRFGGVALTSKAKHYREYCGWFVPSMGWPGEVSLILDIYPPDKLRRDVDNVCKAVLDALEHAELFRNDNQISTLLVRRREPHRPDGKIVVGAKQI